MLTTQDWQNLSTSVRNQVLARPKSSKLAKSQVQTILETVRTQGDRALYDLTQQWDHVSLSSLKVSKQTLDAATISHSALTALKAAIQTLTCYHQATIPEAIRVDTASGISIDRIWRPIEKVGLYVPGGNNTPLVSSLLMQAIPALLAGCPLRLICTPPNSSGSIDPILLVASRLCGIDEVYTVGGAQAIAAMAYGTETIPKVYKIFGPGNAYVTDAKSLVALDPDGAAIDMPAGPSEVMIVADDYANPAFVAADLLAQAEHGPDSQVICLCESETFASKVNRELGQQMPRLSRQSIILPSLQHGALIICKERKEQVDIINAYAPEHLIINRQDASDWVKDITSAGTVFLGPWAAETMGDYVTGSNHVLPTNGFARSYSGLSSLDFLKSLSIQSITESGIRTLGTQAQTLAKLEGLDAHANAVALRLDSLGEIR
jgi:histidinol dehydrogenase